MSTLVTALMFANVLAPEAGWEELLVTGEQTPWKFVDPNWIFAADARLEKNAGKLLEAIEPGSGSAWVNGPKGSLRNLVTKKNYKDCEIQLEFMLGKGSNSGVKFHALYEIQFRDSAGKSEPLTGNDMGGIYPKAEERPKYRLLDDGVPPKVNAAKPAGEWQTLTATWRSPRFDAKGEKVEHARLMKAVLNGQTIHENVEVKTPTGSNYVKPDTPSGPLLLQCDHGPVAFRNVKIRAID